MKKVMMALLSLTLAQGVRAQGTVYEGFRNPPQEARPRVWWHWMDGNVSMDGILKDTPLANEKEWNINGEMVVIGVEKI